eukprot:CAMPEP_0183291836 /NCGR_PEP_ID=MMETSP0160_2-20130417/1105_1 /TAXON_ID=2839 ORGANISM="Odontella Sinensis, Strain Grunow 1884" /NCGR_SAMPLE_ID=MMETSP0160_2 /ASSEMBLY_ACC=CAM_ASM_000250 /LENGTH=173 /DNA_ID=CAMNT_0025452695 /DNA_START=107 /DNA_END=628 /DNA_ORIENTATION=+
MARGRRGGGGGRSGGGGGGLFGSRSKPAPPKPAARSASTTAAPPARAPAAAPPAVPQQSSGGGMMSGLASTVAQGMAFGTGSAIAHRAVGAVAGSFSGGGDAEVPQQTAEAQGYDGAQMAGGTQPAMPQGACSQDKQMFFECLQVNRGDQDACRFLYETLQTCQRNESQMQFS